MPSGAKKPILVTLDAYTRMKLNAEVAWRQRENPDTIIHRAELIREALDWWLLAEGRRRERDGFPGCVFEAMNMKVDLPPECFR